MQININFWTLKNLVAIISIIIVKIGLINKTEQSNVQNALK